MHILLLSLSLSLSLSVAGFLSSIGMLAVSPLRNSTPCERAGDAGSANLPVANDFSAEFDFDFSELFAGFADGEGLSGLEVDHSEIMAYFPSPETVAVVVETMEAAGSDGVQHEGGAKMVPEREEMFSIKFEEVLSGGMMEKASLKMFPEVTSSPAPEKEKGRKPSAGHAKGSNGKRKIKVDWTPELHRQFVQAVEQLGLEKAVPSRILELMGIDCLTRHNVASHLQKYRSSRKHTSIREVEAASWSQRRQAYTMTTTGNTIGPMRESSPWLVAPTMGFPPGAPLPHHHLPQMTSFRSLHVWGHPTMDQSSVHMWPPKHLFPIRPTSSSPWVMPYHQFPPPHPPPHASPWSTHFSSGTLIQGRPYFSQQVPAMRFAAPPVPGIPPHPMYRPEGALPTDTSPTQAPTKLTSWQLHHDAHPSKESIDATIGEVLAQPWLPVPLGLKPPSLESVLLELQKQGIPTVPPCS